MYSGCWSYFCHFNLRPMKRPAVTLLKIHSVLTGQVCAPHWFISWSIVHRADIYIEDEMFSGGWSDANNAPYYKAQNNPLVGFVPLPSQYSCSYVFHCLQVTVAFSTSSSVVWVLRFYVWAHNGLLENTSAYIFCLCSICLSGFTSFPIGTVSIVHEKHRGVKK